MRDEEIEKIGVGMSWRQHFFSLIEGMRSWLEMIKLKYLTLAHNVLMQKWTKAITFGLVLSRDLTQDGNCLGL